MANYLFLFIMLIIYLCMGESKLETPKPCAPCICKLDQGIYLAICNNTVMHMDSTIHFTSVISKITKKVQGIQMIQFSLPEITKTLFNKLEFDNLTDFAIKQCGLNKIDKDSFNHNGLQNIESLSLSENNITELEDYSFYGLTALKYLKLDHNKLTEIKSKNIFGSCSLLEEINLSSNELTYISRYVFLNNKMLKQIDLSENKLRSIEYYLISHLNLTYLLVETNEWDCKLMNTAIVIIVQEPFYDNKSVCTYPEKFKNIKWTDYMNEVRNTSILIKAEAETEAEAASESESESVSESESDPKSPTKSSSAGLIAWITILVIMLFLALGSSSILYP